MDTEELYSMWQELTTIEKGYFFFLALLYRKFVRVVAVSLVAALFVYTLLEPHKIAAPAAVLAGYYGALISFVL